MPPENVSPGLFADAQKVEVSPAGFGTIEGMMKQMEAKIEATQAGTGELSEGDPNRVVSQKIVGALSGQLSLVGAARSKLPPVTVRK